MLSRLRIPNVMLLVLGLLLGWGWRPSGPPGSGPAAAIDRENRSWPPGRS